MAWWIPRSYANFRLRLGYTQLSRVHPVLQGPVFRKPISANPGLNFNLDFYTSLFDSLFEIIFSTQYGASNHQIVDKKNSTLFYLFCVNKDFVLSGPIGKHARYVINFICYLFSTINLGNFFLFVFFRWKNSSLFSNNFILFISF